MGKTLGIDRDTARRIKHMNTKELDGYLTRVTDKSYNNGYEEGLVNGIALVKGEEALQKSTYSTFYTHIRHSKKVNAWTFEKGKSLVEVTPKSAATRDYKNLALEYMDLTKGA